MKRKITLKTLLTLTSLGLMSFGANAQTARLQAIHNSADAAASTVDVYLGSTLLINNFAFRTATPFIDAPAGTPIVLGIAPATSTSVADTITSFTYNLTSGETYILVAEGIVSPTGYSPATPFTINVYGMGRESANMMSNTDVLIHHGSTDAPTVDVVEVGAGAGTIVNDASFGDFTNYLELPTSDYIVEIRDASGTTKVASYLAPLSTLGLNGDAITVIASGFLNPAVNSGGPAFGLYAATAAGGPLVQLPATPNARVQVIHNSADAAAASVDVYINTTKAIDNFNFRTASPFVDVLAGTPVKIGIAPSTSTSVADTIASFTFTLNDGETYIVVADGIVSTTGYSPIKPFGLEVYAMGREVAATTGNTDVLVHHGSTDAPIVDVYETGVGAGLIIDDFEYKEFAGYLSLPTNDYTLEVRDQTGTTTVAAYQAPLSTLGLTNQALVVVASGFLNPSLNSGGPGFGLWAALASGGALVELPLATTGVNELENASVNIYPNPASNVIHFTNAEFNFTSVTIRGIDGGVVLRQELNGVNQGTIAVEQLAAGCYIAEFTNGTTTLKNRIVVAR